MLYVSKNSGHMLSIIYVVTLVLCYIVNTSCAVESTFIEPLAHSNLRCQRRALKRNQTHDQHADFSHCNDSLSWPSHATQTKAQTQSEMIKYLYNNLMPFDSINANSLGFPADMCDSCNELPDGLSEGILEPSINISIYAKQNYPWTSNISKEMYYEYVVNFANVNEARTNWRPIFHEMIQSIIKPFLSSEASVSTKEVIKLLNDKIWDVAATYSNTETITFQHGQTPLIYDPMSILIFGYASCTGLSIFFVNVLRTAGIPARLAGTAAWNGKEANGNHSWIEVWDSDDQQWRIFESKPASGDHSNIDIYDPCQWWFCNEEKTTNTKFWAARIDQEEGDGVHFPLAWDTKNKAVVGEDRTNFMREICAYC